MLLAAGLAGVLASPLADDQVLPARRPDLELEGARQSDADRRGNSHQKFKLDLMGYCTGLTFKQTLGFKSFGGTDLSCLTPGDYVLVACHGDARHCPIKTIEALHAGNGKSGQGRARRNVGEAKDVTIENFRVAASIGQRGAGRRSPTFSPRVLVHRAR